jgi:hypothetical protein
LHFGDGVGAIVSSWSLYVLIVAGAATMLLAVQALAADPLAVPRPDVGRASPNCRLWRHGIA